MMIVRRKQKEKKSPPLGVAEDWVLRSPLHLGNRERNVNNNGTGGGKHKHYKRLNSEEAKPSTSAPSFPKKSKKKNSLDSSELLKQTSWESLTSEAVASSEAATSSQEPAAKYSEEIVKLPAEYVLSGTEHLLQKRRISGHRVSYRKAIQKAGYMNELVASTISSASPVLQRNYVQKSEIDWTENALTDDHLWAPSNASGDLCYVGEQACSKSGPRKKCSACHIVVHDACYEQLVKIGFGCKITFRDASTRNTRESMVLHHHWVHRRKQDGKCKHCGKTFERRFGFREQTKIISISCSWCSEAYHNKIGCFQIHRINEPCTLGSHAKSIVPSTWIIKTSQKQKSLRNRSKKKRSSSNTFRKKSSRDRPRTFIIRPLSHQVAFVSPILVFINPKSGGNQGAKLLHAFQWTMNPRQVFDLSKGGPQEGLELYKKVSNLRVLACGGDGTVGWILSVIDKLNLTRPPPLAILPLGTGNDLSRTLNFGPGYSDEPIQKIIQGVEEGKPAKLDRWKLHVEKNEQAHKSPDDDETPLTGEDPHSAGVDQPPLDVVNNYFSIGSDAQVVLAFHESREAHPDKFNSRIGNKIYYARAGVSQYLTGQSKDMSKHITVECDGQSITQKIRNLKPVCLVFLNIPRYSSGTSPWGNPAGSEFSVQRHDDKLIEVLAFTANQLGMIFVGGHGERLCQCRSARITTYKTFPVQVDGEPCRLNPSNIRFEFFNQANVLYKAKKTPVERELSVQEQIKIRLNVISSHDFDRHCGSKEKLKTCAVPYLVTVAMNNSTLEVLRSCFDDLNSDEKSSDRLAERWFFLDPTGSNKFYRIDRTQEHLHPVRNVINADGELFVLECPEASPATSNFPRSQNVDKTIFRFRGRVQSDIGGQTDRLDYSDLSRPLDFKRSSFIETDSSVRDVRERRSPAALDTGESPLDVVFEHLSSSNEFHASTDMTSQSSAVTSQAVSIATSQGSGEDASPSENVTGTSETTAKVTSTVVASNPPNMPQSSADTTSKPPDVASQSNSTNSLPTLVVSNSLSRTSSDPDASPGKTLLTSQTQEEPHIVTSHAESNESQKSTPTKSICSSSTDSPVGRLNICESDCSTYSTSSNEYVLQDDVTGDPLDRNTAHQSSLMSQKSPQKSPLRSSRSIPPIVDGQLLLRDFVDKLDGRAEDGEQKKKKKKQHKRSSTDTDPKKTMEGSMLLSNFVKTLKISGNDNNNNNNSNSLAQSASYGRFRYLKPLSIPGEEEACVPRNQDSHVVDNGFLRRHSHGDVLENTAVHCYHGDELSVSNEDSIPVKTRSQHINPTSDPSRDAAFLEASKQGNLPAMKAAVSHGASLHATDPQLRTALHLAAQFAHVHVVDYLIEEAPRMVEAMDAHLQSPLHRAAWLGRMQICERLVNAGSIICRSDDKRKTVIDRAKQSGNTSLVNFLIDKHKSRLQRIIPNLDETDL